MMTIEELRTMGAEMSGRIGHLHEFLGIEALKAEFKELEDKMAAPDFWDNKEAAQETVGKFSSCRGVLDPFIQLEQSIAGLNEAIEMAAEEPEFLPDAESDALKISKELDKYEILSFLSGKFDRKNMYLTIHAGAGGTESCDW
ncbi:MAG: PCRF domain-containing protein, partial [Lentisphaeria bacterium]|nr:PCRF domain-containing protein [Lentisphaeria bacterium]